MSELTEALEALLREHARIGSPVPGYLRPGVPPDRVRSQIVDAIGLEPHPDLVELFGWHDGIDDEAWVRDAAGTGFARLFGDTHFAPLADAVASYRESIEIDATTALYSDGAIETWKASWFPAFCQGWDTFGIECDPGSPNLGRVYHPSWEPPDAVGPGPRFRDLPHLVDSVTRRFQADGYWWNAGDGFLEERLEVLDQLYEREIAEARA